ncbi:hypothetical protein [Natrialbaceae archaeon AArc-T1-2]|uniref:hypothetical protein n=1 Tax=Natrialbaceae archaeon AArc-T1-2 TaxID=3053904 RepID=UPI00255B34DE|nr:hypothetical protein [Natrialbaceae archaeon AArc-T1-2]WIV65717.1 hypothetical protein QQ977_08350 [Natrialbaceae archaeon AArc-T1-2]
MHPSRLVALCCCTIGVLVVSQAAVVGQFRLDLESGLRLAGGAGLVLASLYAAARSERDPIVTEYGPRTYLLVAAAFVWIAGLSVRLALTVS